MNDRLGNFNLHHLSLEIVGEKFYGNYLFWKHFLLFSKTSNLNVIIFYGRQSMIKFLWKGILKETTSFFFLFFVALFCTDLQCAWSVHQNSSISGLVWFSEGENSNLSIISPQQSLKKVSAVKQCGSTAHNVKPSNFSQWIP